MSIAGNTTTEMRIKSILGERGAAYARFGSAAAVRTLMRLPLQSLRLVALRLAGAHIGEDLVFASGVEVLSPWRLTLGSHTNIGRNAHLDARGDLAIGDNVNISDEVAIWTAEHDIQSPDFVMTRGPVVIESRAWICYRSVVMPGVRIGEGSVVAAAAVVTKSVAPFSIVGGVPARVIGSRNRELTYQLGDPRRSRTA